MVHYITYTDGGIEAIACAHSADTIRVGYNLKPVWTNRLRPNYAVEAQSVSGKISFSLHRRGCLYLYFVDVV